MAALQELPAVVRGQWWGTDAQVSPRLLVESAAMRELFDRDKPHELVLPYSDWDVRRILIITHELTLKKIRSERYELGWDVRFAMEDGGRLAKTDDIYTLKFFYPNNFPYSQPVRALIDPRGHSMTDDYHTWKNAEIEGKTYALLCDNNHTRNFLEGHDPAKTNSAMHAVRAILWLRSNLYSKKNGGRMREYG